MGNILDLKYISYEIKKLNKETKIFVDGVAGLPHIAVNVNEYNIDGYVFSYYKFCGLRISCMYLKNDFFNIINNQNHYMMQNEFEKKLELGGINYELLASINGIENYFLDTTEILNITSNEFTRKLYEKIMFHWSNYEKTMSNALNSHLINNNEIINLQCEISEKVPIFSFYFKNYSTRYINLILNELGYLTSFGKMYADRFFELNNIEDVIRISIIHYNTLPEIDNLTETLRLFKIEHSNLIYEFNFKNPVSNFLKKSFNNLTKDKYYDSERYRHFSLIKLTNKVEIIGDLPFTQSKSYNSSYNGNLIRNYNNIDIQLLNDESFTNFIDKFKNYYYNNYKNILKYMKIHQIRVSVKNDAEISLPEGIHQDGYNMIAIICINRNNIKGGINKIYDLEKEKIAEYTLLEGDMIILNDRKTYHDVTGIKVDKIDNKSYRDIFVFTTIS